MASKEPRAESMLYSSDASVAPWEEISDRWRDSGTSWLATVRPDGRPHVVPVGAVWLDGAMYFTTGQRTRKGQNLVRNSHCVVSSSRTGFDLVVEGPAAKLTDEYRLQRVAEAYNFIGWPVTVRDGAFTAAYSAPTTGPPPYDVYEVTPTVAFAFGTDDSTVNQATRYRF
jgi:Pyridoxamine 5'-phosphate oxidase